MGRGGAAVALQGDLVGMRLADLMNARPRRRLAGTGPIGLEYGASRKQAEGDTRHDKNAPHRNSPHADIRQATNNSWHDRQQKV
jgi:hypothetical protein